MHSCFQLCLISLRVPQDDRVVHFGVSLIQLFEHCVLQNLIEIQRAIVSRARRDIFLFEFCSTLAALQYVADSAYNILK